MKIGTYNLYNLYDIGGAIDGFSTEVISEKFFNDRVMFFTKKFRELSLDILCLQEVGGEKAVTCIAEALGYEYFFASPDARGIRVAVLYKKELAGNVKCERLSFGELHVPSLLLRGDTLNIPALEQRREILEVTLNIGGKLVSINTFHLKSNLPSWLEDDDREGDSSAYTDAKFRCIFYKTMELRALRSHVNNRLKEGKEVVLLGDYNENNTASIMGILKDSQNEDLKLLDVLEGYVGSVATYIHRGMNLTFDTIIVSQGLKNNIRNVFVENKDLKDFKMLPLGSVILESDHAMVWMDLDIGV